MFDLLCCHRVLENLRYLLVGKIFLCAVQAVAHLGKLPNGLRYLRWGGDGEAVQPEKCSGVENCLRFAQNPQRQVHALLGGVVD
jgi:hypothetical protein